MSDNKVPVVAWVSATDPMFLGGWRSTTPILYSDGGDSSTPRPRIALVLATDYEAAIARAEAAEALLRTTRRALAEQTDMHYGTPCAQVRWNQQAEILTGAGKRVTDAFRARGEAQTYDECVRTQHECEAAMLALDAAIAAQQAGG